MISWHLKKKNLIDQNQDLLEHVLIDHFANKLLFYLVYQNKLKTHLISTYYTLVNVVSTVDGQWISKWWWSVWYTPLVDG